MEPILEDMKALSECSDPEYRSKRARAHENMEYVSRLLGLSRAEVGEICIDIFSCICVEDISPETEDFDTIVTEIKKSVYGLVDDRLSARH